MGSKDETRTAILHAATELFDHFGPTKTSIADIARKMGMSPANIYNFYASRDAIIEAVGEIQLAVLRQQIEAEMRSAPTEWAALTIMFLSTSRHILDRLRNEKDILHLQVLERRYRWRFISDFYRFLYAAAESCLRRGMDAGRFARLDPVWATDALFDCMASALEPLLIVQLERADHEPRLIAQLALLERAFCCPALPE